MLAVQHGRPIFLVGAFGGVPALVMDVISGIDRAEMTWEYQRGAPFAAEMREIYRRRKEEWLGYPKMVRILREKGLTGLNPLLTKDEHLELLVTRDTNRMIELILVGLEKIAQDPSPQSRERAGTDGAAGLDPTTGTGGLSPDAGVAAAE